MLTDPACRNAVCPVSKARARLPDAGGLYLEVTPKGSKRWFAKYRFGGKERRLALGSYPAVSLRAARAGRDAARRTLQGGADPVLQRKAEKLTRATSNATTFEAVSREFHDTKAAEWSEQYAEQWIERMQRDLFPMLGALPLRDIGSPALLGALRLVEARGAIDSAHTLRQQAGQVFRFGIATGRCSSDPAASLKGALKSVIVTNMAAITDPAGVATLMRAINGYRGHPVTRGALMLAALTFQRPGNVRAMEWAEIDTDAALWTVPADKMKRKLHGKENGRPHLVPLAKQALAVLAAIRPLTGHGRFVFPSLLTGDAYFGGA